MMILSDLIINDNNNDQIQQCDDDNNIDDRLLSRLFVKLVSNELSYDDDKDDKKENIDDDDDVNVKRRKLIDPTITPITLHHHRSTSLDDVGLQLWRGSLLLSDYLIYLHYSHTITDDCIICELGCGIGLLSIVIGIINDKISSSKARIKKSYSTDYKHSILKLAETNSNTNIHINTSDITFRILDWTIPGFPKHSVDDEDYAWTDNDINYLLSNKVVYLAADVIYDDDLTLNFIKKLHELLKKNDICYVAIEKRYNYSIEKMDVVANGYDYFLSFLNTTDDDKNDIKLYGKRIDINFPQYILNYDRGHDLELYILNC
jgi:hypothetical protein